MHTTLQALSAFHYIVISIFNVVSRFRSSVFDSLTLSAISSFHILLKIIET